MKYNRYEDLKLAVPFFYGKNKFTITRKSEWSVLDLLFLSFSVQSNTGLSDITPVTAQARMLVALQMFVGVMYLALVVSRLIGLQYIKHAPKPPKQ